MEVLKMKKLFISDEGFERVFDRSRAKGHKRLLIEDDVEVMSPVEFVTQDTDLVMKKADDSDEQEVYTMLCKEFGCVGLTTDFRSKISVIFLDDGWMLVTLLHGALVMNLENQLLMPTVGDDFKTPAVVPDDVCWVNANDLLEYGKYFGVKGQFMFDVEFTFLVGGDKINNMRNFSIRAISDEDVDLSLGYIAAYEQKMKAKEDMRETKKIMEATLGAGSSSEDTYEFDDDDEEEDYEDEDETDEYDDY
jgi:hypothetical protein